MQTSLANTTAHGDREIQLDVVRGLAIVLAMGWHLNGGATSPIMDVILFPGRHFGWAGVDLFFVLSGFLVGRLVLLEIQREATFDYRRFLIRRAFRLWPVLYLYLGAQLIAADDPWQSYLPQIFFHLQNYFKTPLDHLWSLAVEEHFYLALGLLLPLLIRKGLKPKIFLFGIFGLIASATIMRWVGLALGLPLQNLQWQTQFRIDALAVGLLLALASVHYSETFDRLRKLRWLWATLALLGFSLLVWTGSGQTRVVIGYSIAAFSSAALILAIYRVPIAPWITPFARVWAFLGLYSYSLYIWHNGFGNVAATKVMAIIHVTNPDAIVVAKYGASVVGAFLVTKLVERPMINLRDRLFPSSRARNSRETQLDVKSAAPRSETA
jgi:peptidoglycan/LPS O-acetylase OafA/YrhL